MQRPTKHAHKTKYRVTRTPLKTGGELNNRNNHTCNKNAVDPIYIL